jgi:dTMP kinase
MFIVFEGLDCSGKTVLIERLQSNLESKFGNIVVTRDPRGTALGCEIMRFILSNSLDPSTECLLFAAARSILVETVIRPEISKHNIILCDRYYDSMYAYQGIDVPTEFINSLCVGLPQPDLVILLDVNEITMVNRLKKSLTFG